jgi:hypothetical protein
MTSESFTPPDNADNHHSKPEEKPQSTNDARLETSLMQIEIDYSIRI